MGFLAPAWLYGLTALAVPLAIHLWSRRKARVIPVGSVRLLEGLPPIAHRTVALEDVWLLLLRLALLAAVVLALAGAFLPAGGPDGPEHRVLVAADVARSSVVAGIVDSLSDAGAEIETFAVDPWSAIAIAADSLPEGSRVTVVSPLNGARFRGVRPRVHVAVEWLPVDPPSRDAEPSHADLVTSIVVADGAHAADARYLRAALASIAEGHGDSVVEGDSSTTPAPGVWLFWLRSDAVPAGVMAAVERGATLFQLTAPGPAAPPTRLALGAGPSDRRVILHHLGLDSLAGHTLWRDGGGRPVLTVARAASGRHFRLAGRLDPSWSDLVLLPAFPLALERLLHGPPPPPPGRLTLAQALPRTIDGPSPTPAGASLVTPLWILAVLLFLADRVMALRRSAA